MSLSSSIFCDGFFSFRKSKEGSLRFYEKLEIRKEERFQEETVTFFVKRQREI